MLTTGASEALQLTNEEQVNVQAAINRLRDEARKAVVVRAELDSQASNPERGITAYRIPAAPDRGESLLNAFEERVRSDIGQNRADRLRESFDPRGKFGGFGRYDVAIEFQDAQPEGVAPQVSWEYRDPDTGELRSSGKMREDVFRGYYGETFDRLSSEEHE